MPGRIVHQIPDTAFSHLPLGRDRTNLNPSLPIHRLRCSVTASASFGVITK
jgi:hypothetical protein